MRTSVILIAAAALFVPSLVPPAFGGDKPLPPAFGKELVPDQQTQQRNESKAAEMEDEQAPRKQTGAGRGRQGARGKIHIQLDGDEDGGGDAGDDGGEF